MTDQNPGGFVTQEKTDDGVNIIAVTDQGVTTHDVPGGLTEDELLD